MKLANVSIVKYKSNGKRFEIACYPNKVLEWRKGTEKDLDNVLQIQSIFANVSKGQLASGSDLEVAFKGVAQDKVILIVISSLFKILEKGELQVGEKERNQVLID